MNIFVLSHCPDESAKWMCDKHVVKMILESVQMLYCAWHVSLEEEATRLGQKEKKGEKVWVHNPPCKKTHVNHPCSVWVRTSPVHYTWLWEHVVSLCKEYTIRFGKIHAYEKRVMDDLMRLPPLFFPRPSKSAKLVEEGLPDGWEYGAVAIEEGLFASLKTKVSSSCPDGRSKEGGDVVALYREYYKHKRGVMDMAWRRLPERMPFWMMEESIF